MTAAHWAMRECCFAQSTLRCRYLRSRQRPSPGQGVDIASLREGKHWRRGSIGCARAEACAALAAALAIIQKTSNNFPAFQSDRKLFQADEQADR